MTEYTIMFGWKTQLTYGQIQLLLQTNPAEMTVEINTNQWNEYLQNIRHIDELMRTKIVKT